MIRLARRTALFLLLIVISGSKASPEYNVHWLGGPTTIEQDVPSMKKALDIYCYSGTDKNILAIWQTVKFHIRIKSDKFEQYVGESPEEVYRQYTEDSASWGVAGAFQRRQRALSLPLFAPTCLAVTAAERHTIELHVQRVDLWRVLLMCGGVALVLWSRALSGNPLFFYLCGVAVGVTASFMLLVYYFSKLLPRRTLTYGVLIGGWTVGVYVLQRVWDNARSLLASYQAWAVWYTLAAALASLALCYRVGPPRDPRSRDLVMWTLQGAGALLVLLSSQHQEAAGAAALAALLAKHFPRTLLHRIQGYWRRRFPPRPVLLTSEQYYEQGARETQRALDQLRRHCASPEAQHWRLVLRLSDAKRFAQFVQGESHLSDDEVLDYESYAFSLQRKRRGSRTPSRSRTPPRSRTPSRSRTPPRLLDISDDESLSDDS